MATFYSLFCYYSLYYVWNFFWRLYTVPQNVHPFNLLRWWWRCCFCCCKFTKCSVAIVIIRQKFILGHSSWFCSSFFLKNIFSAMRNVDLTKGTVTKMFIKHYTIYMYNTRNAYWKNFSVSKLRCRVIS